MRANEFTIEGQIYFQGGGGPESQRWYKPRHVPNQHELDERMVLGSGSDASDAGSKVQGESLRDENPCWKGYKPVGTKKKNGKTVPNCVPK